MAISSSNEIEVNDLAGSVEIVSGTVGTTAIDIPTVAGEVLQGAMINNPNSGSNKDLIISLDGYTNEYSIPNSSTHFIPFRGGVTQFELKGQAASLGYEIILYKEEV